MLVLSRKIGESVVIGETVVVTVSRVAGNRVTLGIDAPGTVRVRRKELRAQGESLAGAPHPCTDRHPRMPTS
jgi:carbon storage regulator